MNNNPLSHSRTLLAHWQKHVVKFLLLCVLALSLLTFATLHSMSHVAHFTGVTESRATPLPLDPGGGGPW